MTIHPESLERLQHDAARLAGARAASSVVDRALTVAGFCRCSGHVRDVLSRVAYAAFIGGYRLGAGQTIDPRRRTQ